MKRQRNMMNRETYISQGPINRKGIVAVFLFLIIAASGAAQSNKETEKEQKQAKELLSEASLEMQKENFASAEADYRKAIALDPKDETGKYNLGTAYYDKNKNNEAQQRFKQSASVAETKPEKHKSFHNLGNTYMNDKKYQEAVDAYKNALRNNPNDDETRYNLALAKKMLEEEQNQGGGDDGDKEQNKQDKDKDQEQDKKDKQDQGENGDKKEDQKEQDQGEEKEDKKEGENEKDKGKPEEKEGKGEEKPQQPIPGKLSPQQVKSLLEAMNNQEKKVQEKINAQKTKGAKVKSNKDW